MFIWKNWPIAKELKIYQHFDIFRKFLHYQHLFNKFINSTHHPIFTVHRQITDLFTLYYPLFQTQNMALIRIKRRYRLYIVHIRFSHSSKLQNWERVNIYAVIINIRRPKWLVYLGHKSEKPTIKNWGVIRRKELLVIS